MKFFGWEITKRKGMQVGGHRAHDEHIVLIEQRLDKLEHHRSLVEVKTEVEAQVQDEIQEVLNTPGVRRGDTGGDGKDQPGANIFGW